MTAKIYIASSDVGDVRLTRTFLRLLNTSNFRPQEARSRHRRMPVSNL